MKRGARIAAFAIVLALARVTPARAGRDRSEVLVPLHDGRFEAARQALRHDGSPPLPDDLFFDAFTSYWQAVFDDENEELRDTLEAKLNAAIDAAEKAVDAGAPDAALWGGSSHLLLAELRASQRRPLAAAFEAKKAKRLLESSALVGVDATDALFGRGTYNYLADAIPSYVKGLRALLFLPKGNRELGLQQLETTASSSRSFGMEARIFLITIFANKRERLYGRALEERDHMLHAFPETVCSAYASALLDLYLGRFESSRASLVRAEVRMKVFGDVDPVVSRSFELLRARAELASLRPDRARETTLRALATGVGLGPSIRRGLVEIRDAAVREAEGIAWPATGEGTTPDQDAATFSALAMAHPDQPILALMAGDAHLRAGRSAEALEWLRRGDVPSLPPDLQAGCHFRQAQAHDLAGRRSEAIALYARAAATSGYAARDGAAYYQQVPFGPVP